MEQHQVRMSNPPTRYGSLFVFAIISDEPSHMHRVFSAFSHSRFDGIHISTSLILRSSTPAEIEASAAELLI
jgi:hypothetical protein